MNSRIIRLAAAGVVSALMASASWAADEAKFLESAIQGSIAEVKVGQLAQHNAASADVKAFGDKLIRDHSTAMDKAAALAKTMNVPVPTEPKPEAEDVYERLQALNGPEFDKAFVAAMIEDHKKDIRAFEQEAKGKDQVAQFAQTTLPTLQTHLKMAESLEAQQK
jgi:putative membrane protein